MPVFKPCQGKHACRDDGQRCLTCGRSLDEIGRLRDLIQGLVLLANEYEYENSEEYSQYVTRKLSKSINYTRHSDATVNLYN